MVTSSSDTAAFNLKALDLQQLYNKLYPLCRSITGLGYRQSLAILQEYMPLQIEAFTSGSSVCNWTVPPEWILHHATLKDRAGSVLLDTDIDPMCLLNYSCSFHGKVSRQELEAHLFSLPNQPSVIPYATSYYKSNWGFCLSEQQKGSLQDDYYQVDIDTEHKADGAVLVGSCELKGKSDRIVLLTSYLCHPCMLNNELSGPIALVYLYYLLAALPERQYTYRFVINPETIGSICYLSSHAQELKEKVEYGMVLTCLASHYKTGHGISPIKSIDPQALLARLQEQHSFTANSEECFSALHEEIHNSISQNFLAMPLIFKLSRQSQMDEIAEALHPQFQQQHTGSNLSGSSSLQQRYYPEYHAAQLNGTEHTHDPRQSLDDARMQQQMDMLQRSAPPLLSSSGLFEHIELPSSAYTYGIDRFLTSWQERFPQDVALIPFTPTRGSDERQYCSALLNLPMVSVIRSMHGIDNYAAYHTKADNQAEFSLDSIVDSALKIFDVLQAYALCQHSILAQYIGEPQLGKYQLYPDINSFNVSTKRMTTRYGSTLLPNILKLLSLADGSLSIEELAKILNISLYELMDLVRTLESKHLIAYQAPQKPAAKPLATTTQAQTSA